MTAPLRVCVVEDPKGTLAPRLRKSGVSVAFQVRDVDGLVAELDRRSPQLAILDATHVAPERLSALTRKYPGLRLVAVLPRMSAVAATRFRAAGVSDCVKRPDGNTQVLADALKAAVALTPVDDGLTPREREVLGHVSAGFDNLQIAALLGITERTVKAHVGNLYRKTGAHSRVGLALAGRSLG
jgi:DNA-binding NarL/FixJ family response regulator